MKTNQKLKTLVLSLAALVALPVAGYQIFRGPTASLTARADNPPASTAPVEKAALKDGVYSLTLPQYPPDLPDGKGKAEFAAACAVCHSYRYITNQPRFARKTWQAEVTKMIKVYGAPVSDEQAKPIVDYLVQINGKEDPPAR